MKSKIKIFALAISIIIIAGFYLFGRSIWEPTYLHLSGLRTIEDVVKEYGPRAEMSLKPAFEKAELSYPPKNGALLGFKDEKRLELWAKNQREWIFITSFDIKAASGTAGPKLKEGDRQVPEGIYQIQSLNPNSNFHLSMQLNYPNEFDRRNAKADGRQNIGGDIFIHGKSTSAGCLAMGDKVAEQLFILINRVGMKNVTVIIAPYDFRRGMATNPILTPTWLTELYKNISSELDAFKIK